MRGREILLGVRGGLAAYKAAAVASGLVQAGAGVSVIMTPSATRFIGPTTFEALTGRPVHSDLFSPREHYQGEHIGLARRAELAIVSPATAQTLARLAHGLADDLLSTTLLCFTGPVLRSTGVDYDVRKTNPYLIYDRLDIDVPLGEQGDNYDRYLVRMEEMRQSMLMIDQCMAQMPEGPVSIDDLSLIHI